MAQMTVHAAGAWQTVKGLYAHAAGSWQSIKTGWVRSGGVWRQFYTSVVTPINSRYGTAGTFTETIPAGFNTLTIEDWGPTGYGGHGNVGNGTQGGGGGSGGYSRSVYSVSLNAGQTFTVVITAGASGLNTTVTNNTFTTSVNMNAPCGGNGGFGGAGGGIGGSAGAAGSGGNDATSPGNPGDPGDSSGDGLGGGAVIGLYASGNSGPSGNYITTTNPGFAGVVNFHYS